MHDGRERAKVVPSLPFDLGNLQIFLAVCDHGSMAEAARRVGVSQPAISQSLAELERRLGVTMFDRTVRPLGLTPSGHMLRQMALSLLAEAYRIAPAVRDAQRGKAPLIRVGLVDSVVRALTVPLSDYLRSSSRQICIYSGFLRDHAEGIINRNVDIMIGGDSLEDLDALERYELLQEPYIVIMPRSHAGHRLTDLQELADTLPLIRYSARTATGRRIDQYLRRVRLEALRSHECDSPYTLTATVAAGAGWAITTPLCTYESDLLSQVHILPLPDPGFSRRINLICRKGEFGRLPRDMADRVRDLLQDNVISSVATHLPGIAERMRILDRRAQAV